MKMINMKCSDKAQEVAAPVMARPEMPEYPYGLRLCLNEESLQRMKIEDLPEIGTEMMIVAKVKVCCVSSNESEHGKNRSLDLQITEMGIGKGKSPEKMAKDWYGG